MQQDLAAVHGVGWKQLCPGSHPSLLTAGLLHSPAPGYRQQMQTELPPFGQKGVFGGGLQILLLVFSG